jgi:hypothetical protein
LLVYGHSKLIPLIYFYFALIYFYAALPPTPPEAPDQVPEIDAVYAAEAPLRRLLALASVVVLPQQIEREEASVLRRRPVASLVTQGHVATLSVLGERAAGAGELVLGSDLEEHVPSSGSAK